MQQDAASAAFTPMTALSLLGRDAMQGDLPEFEEFVAARQQRLLRVAFLLTRDHHRAEDLLQDAFL